MPAAAREECLIQHPDHPRNGADHHQHETEIDGLIAKQSPQHRQRQNHQRVSGYFRQPRLLHAGRAGIALRPEEPAVNQNHQDADDACAQKTYEKAIAVVHQIPLMVTTSQVQLVFLPTCKTAKKASCGISTWPTCFMRFLPAFCFSSSLRLRVMSPP